MEITAVYTSMRYLTLSEVWMIISFTPCLSALLCWYWLDEAFSRIQGRCCREFHPPEGHSAPADGS